MNRGELFKTYDALSAGAVDVLEKPSEAVEPRQWEQRYRQALRRASRIKVITHPRARLSGGQVADLSAGLAEGEAAAYRCVAVGVSTGGPGAVVRILQHLPPDYPLPILLVIHISTPFGVALTDWLNTVSPVPVRQAVDGQPLPDVGQPGVIMPPPDRHMVVRGGRLWCDDQAERHHCRPSVDVLLESLGREMPRQTVGCLLTGMGRDGAAGLLAIRRGGGMTIAQDERTCVVFGMPREAIRVGAACLVLGLDEIAPALRQFAPAAAAPAEKRRRR